jgi:hypothetical protein
MNHSIHLLPKQLALSDKLAIRFTGGNKMGTTHTMTNLMGNRLYGNRRQANPFARVILFFKIRGNKSLSSTEAARLAQITRNTRPMVGMGPIIRNR